MIHVHHVSFLLNGGDDKGNQRRRAEETQLNCPQSSKGLREREEGKHADSIGKEKSGAEDTKIVSTNATDSNIEQHEPTEDFPGRTWPEGQT